MDGVGSTGMTVGEVAELSGLTVRTLHHYDQIGLVVPKERSAGGYRLYSRSDVERLQQVLAYRALGLPLDEIASVLDEDADVVGRLERQQALISREVGRLQRLLESVTRTLEARRMGISLTPEELFEVFGENDPTQHADEAEQRWGSTPAYEESQRRTSRYRKEDWLRVKADGDRVNAGIVNVFRAGAAPDSTEAMDAVEEHRRHISRWFYDCTPEMQVGLAEMYLADPRFTEYYEKQANGLAQYVHDAIVANADRQTGRGEKP